MGVIAREEGIRGLWSGATPTIMRNGTNQMCLFWAKNNFDRILWGKHEGDGRQLTLLQSMGSGFSAACLGPFATGPFDVVKVSHTLQVGSTCNLLQPGILATWEWRVRSEKLASSISLPSMSPSMSPSQ